MRKPYEVPALTVSATVVDATKILAPKGAVEVPFKGVIGSVGFGL
jgi:hypothetical protein